MSKRRRYFVSPTGDGNWKVQKERSKRASDIFEKKEEAIKRGRELAKKNPPGQLVIQKRDGKFQTEYTYGDDPYPPEG